MKTTRFALAAAALSGFASFASADVILSNLANATASNWLSLGLLGAPTGLAADFTMSSTATLASATLRLNISSTASPLVTIWSADSTTLLPLTQLYTLTGPGSYTTGYQNWTFTAPSGATLSAGSTYALVIQRSAGTGGTIAWNSSGGVSPTGSLASFNNVAKFTAAGGWQTQATGPAVFELDSVPAPGALALAGMGGFVTTRRRRR